MWGGVSITCNDKAFNFYASRNIRRVNESVGKENENHFKYFIVYPVEMVKGAQVGNHISINGRNITAVMHQWFGM